jgi:hypothetical protein
VRGAAAPRGKDACIPACTISLGIGQIMADEDAEQPTSKTRSSCD